MQISDSRASIVLYFLLFLTFDIEKRNFIVMSISIMVDQCMSLLLVPRSVPFNFLQEV
uniref:Uncharacterized protein n=1 Tax=Arundo donax TaxID=35708 RepID=A0A0A9DQ64_ARUDO